MGDINPANLTRYAVEDELINLPKKDGRVILASSLDYQELVETRHIGRSIFTHYLIEGLKGNEESVDIDGNVTTDTLAHYIFRKIIDLPQRKRPKQKPIIKSETSD